MAQTDIEKLIRALRNERADHKVTKARLARALVKQQPKEINDDRQTDYIN